MKLSRRDKVVTAILVLLILVLLYMLQCHWRNRLGLHRDLKPVGEVEYKYHQVQRKFSDHMLWEDVETKSPVYPYDWVMTKDKSDARITLKSGMKVEMDPESMVEIDETRDGVGLTLRDGTIRADTKGSKSGTITASDGTKIQLSDGSSAQISTDGKNLSVDVKEGKATVKNRNRESKLSAGETGSVDAGSIKKVKTSIILKSPRQDLVFENGAPVVDFVFEAPPGAKNCRIELSSGTRKKRTIRVAAAQHSEKLGDGSYQWKVMCSLNGKTAASPTGAFRVRPADHFALVSPARGQVLRLAGNENIPLRWRGSSRVRVEVSALPDFSAPVKSEETTAQSMAVSGVPAGKYYWRVYPAGDVQQAIKSTFTVVIVDKPKPPEAGKQGETKAGQQTQPQRLTARAIAAATIEPDQKSVSVKISWEPAGKEWAHRVRVSDSRDFSDARITKTVTGEGQLTVSLKPGEYYYRVDMQPAAGGNPVASTAPQKITVVRKKLPGPPRVKSVQAD